jgi:hypothetical protein
MNTLVADSDGFFHFGLVFIAIIAAIAIAIGSYLGAAKRRQELSAFALQNGFSFNAYPGDIHEKYESFKPFDDGHSRRSSNLVHGRRDGIDWSLFDYKFVTGSGKNQQTHHYGIVLAEIDVVLSQMRIRPEGFFDKLAAVVGFDDINFESEEFSRKFYVTATDRKFAYDLIHPKMMEYLMAAPRADWQLGGRVVLMSRSQHYKVDELAGVMNLIDGFVRLIPEYVRQDRGAIGPKRV